MLPAAWPGFRAIRRFRGATYEITVTKPAGARGRVRRLVVDGTPVDGTLLPLAPAGATVQVSATAED